MAMTGPTGTVSHNTSYTYGLNGNILSLSRKGQIGTSGTYDMIDELTYGYSGNQLIKVDDMDDDNHQDNGFTDNGYFQNEEYAYDPNGNMVIDANGKVAVDEYNYLDFPSGASLPAMAF